MYSAALFFVSVDAGNRNPVEIEPLFSQGLEDIGMLVLEVLVALVFYIADLDGIVVKELERLSFIEFAGSFPAVVGFFKVNHAALDLELKILQEGVRVAQRLNRYGAEGFLFLGELVCRVILGSFVIQGRIVLADIFDDDVTMNTQVSVPLGGELIIFKSP